MSLDDSGVPVNAPAWISPSLTLPIELPIRTHWINGLPKLFAAGIPITPLNVALAQMASLKGSTSKSLESYAHAAGLLAEYCALRSSNLIDVPDADFGIFVGALQGGDFFDGQGNPTRLGQDSTRPRGPRTVDHYISLLYSIAGRIQGLYGVAIDWYRYEDGLAARRRGPFTKRKHAVAHTIPKVKGLPKAQWVRALQGAEQLWGDHVARGDKAYAADLEQSRGALFYRNVALLSVLRYAGGRRSEAPELDTSDIDRVDKLIWLVTKGHRIESGNREAVVLLPFLDRILWMYISQYRPLPPADATEDLEAVFVSHSLHGYAQRISPQTVREVVEAVRQFCEPPWNLDLTPHTLRHSFAYDVQRLAGGAGAMANMRHRSYRSLEPYQAGVEQFADELTDPMTAEFADVLRLAKLRPPFAANLGRTLAT